MLFLLDNLIIGPVRERIVIFYIRYKVRSDFPSSPSRAGSTR